VVGFVMLLPSLEIIDAPGKVPGHLFRLRGGSRCSWARGQTGVSFALYVGKNEHLPRRLIGGRRPVSWIFDRAFPAVRRRKPRP